MSILSTDIKLRESERMTDNPDGGGRRTSRVIADGVAGNIFPKVSHLDSVYGRVNLRKVYGHVDTPNLDMFAGAYLIVTDAPDNNRISVVAFSTANDYDNRTAARDRIESYVIAGPVSRMTLYGRQLYGAQALLVYQRDEEPLPEIGEVYAISTEAGGVTSAQQFVRIQDVAHELRTFTDESGEFKRRVITLTIGAPLRHEFNGPATPARLSNSGATGFVRSTTVADASRYFGLQPLAVAAGAGDMTLSVASVYTPIVPTTQRETPLSLISMGGANNLVPASTAKTPWAMVGGVSGVQEGGTGLSVTKVILLPRGSGRGTVEVMVSGWLGITHNPSGTASDDGLGAIGAANAAGYGYYLDGGIVDYAGGVLTLTCRNSNAWGMQIHARFVPAVEVAQVAHTKSVEITLATRGTVYSVPLLPVPALGTLIADYRALGKWYRLRDDGDGTLSGGDAFYGTGTVDPITGGVVVTLGALPDVGSALLLSWGSPAHYEAKTNDAAASAKLTMTLPDLPVKRGSAVVTYYVGGAAMTASADLQGAITGTNSVTGTIKHLTGQLELSFGDKLPDPGSLVSVAYQQITPTVVGESVTASGAFPALTATTLAGAPFDAGGVSIDVTMLLTVNGPNGVVKRGSRVTLVDDGLGHLVANAGMSLATHDTASWAASLATGFASMDDAFVVTLSTVVGTIDYSTGAIEMAATTVPCSGKVWWGNAGWAAHSASAVIVATEDATYSVTLTGIASTDTAKTHSVALDTTPLQLDLLRTSTRPVVPGSVLFAAAGKTYLDRAGSIYTDVSTTTGVGLAVGTIDYATGVVSLTQWVANTSLALAVQSCLTKYGDFDATDVFWRTPGSPIRPASLYVQCTALDGELLTGTSDQNGIITGAAMAGQIEQTMGVVAVRFGAMVTAAGHEAEPWYDAANVVAGQIWQPRQIIPSTLRYSAVVLSNLPLNADVLGLDPVRLPGDGQVPVYRPADVAVVHHTGSVDAGTPAAGSTITAGRTGLSALWLEDANKLKLANTLYVTDLAAGTATMAADLVLTGYTAPITARHRIEEMVLLSDVQINGTLSLTAPLSHAYPLGSLVSSALIFGDVSARVTGVFDQGTWTGVWSDTLIGTQATAQYNDVDYPIEVLNSTAVTDRWRISFTSTSAFQVISENLGVIATGTTAADLAPINPLTSQAYFTLRAAGWGLGWSVGNQLRFDTIGASPPAWLARTVLPGATTGGDSFDAQLRGDVD